MHDGIPQKCVIIHVDLEKQSVFVLSRDRQTDGEVESRDVWPTQLESGLCLCSYITAT